MVLDNSAVPLVTGNYVSTSPVFGAVATWMRADVMDRLNVLVRSVAAARKGPNGEHGRPLWDADAMLTDTILQEFIAGTIDVTTIGAALQAVDAIAFREYAKKKTKKKKR